MHERGHVTAGRTRCSGSDLALGLREDQNSHPWVDSPGTPPGAPPSGLSSPPSCRRPPRRVNARGEIGVGTLRWRGHSPWRVVMGALAWTRPDPAPITTTVTPSAPTYSAEKSAQPRRAYCRGEVGEFAAVGWFAAVNRDEYKAALANEQAVVWSGGYLRSITGHRDSPDGRLHRRHARRAGRRHQRPGPQPPAQQGPDRDGPKSTRPAK